ncbi:hypothetical protein DL89DRAFT_266675 [Linderina pennispora]|uniref:Uncharacterized protein n=1 Tax=Linderina pennispora TaxID=61395 RepID=A0A1Y1WA82_9FUNG|nr:uncharacterized protein DL89DRAFT_266675 [Linderina pennispora]ORX70457.1 hypothetical protein DL89DRAFT_266675 [Linderina pennispora]
MLHRFLVGLVDAKRILEIGDARENVVKLSNITVDVAFLDVDKMSYKYHHDAILERSMLNKSGLFIADDTAFTSVTT